ncbi:ABC transporter permease [Lacisediminihabitans changchengi]|uniref:ABC transporter permease n=1 Tax=Lacisediminihabitans changchengi TaxID=2787634 RepID=A0A934SLC4_9MICO|nr:ABC transporter permease [Lacisediminihabitans changchengi]MBK4347456.1 ABC transporter permease [Lacisediminihabitans changchengi]
MIRFIITRLLLLVLGLLIASALIFFTLRVLPGDVAQVIGGTQATPAQVEAIRKSLGLDRNIFVQYTDWVSGLLRFDLGDSLVTGTPVAIEIAAKLSVTLPLALLSLIFGLAIGIPLGVVSAIRHAKASGAAIAISAQALAAVPAVWAGVLLISVFGLALRWLPTQGFPLDGWDEPGRAIRSLILPALTIGVIEGAVLLRFTRSAALDAIGQDYVRTAAAIGLTKTRALVSHGLPNVMLSVISSLGLQIAGLIVGAVIVEQLFQLPGIGRMLVTDVGNRDLPKVQGDIFTLTAIVLLVGFAVDIAHRLIDPRQRTEVSS